jgi:hypothetical protein
MDHHATWTFGRRIVLSQPNICQINGGHPNVPKDDVKNFIISEKTMTQILGHERAEKCFVDNHKFVGANEGKHKEGEHFLSMKKMDNLPYLNLSTHIATKLGM